mgnify:CR=1 FL=1
MNNIYKFLAANVWSDWLINSLMNIKYEHTSDPPAITRLSKSNQETIWYHRVKHECDKQDSHPDINLTNRIVSLSLSSVDNFPRSILLWELYIEVTKVGLPNFRHLHFMIWLVYLILWNILIPCMLSEVGTDHGWNAAVNFGVFHF